MHGGSALTMITMTLPGFNGLNKQQASGVLGPEWATLLSNAVIDSNSRVAARRGWSSATTSAAAERFVTLHYYTRHDGTKYIIASSNTKLYSSSNDGGAWTDVTNAIAFTAGNWQFVNFNDRVYGAQQGEALIDGIGGNFTQLAVASVPSGNAICAAFGRLWAAASNGTDLQYSALLNGSDWSGTDAGVLDLTNVWTGTDTIQAITEFNGSLVVFGKRNIVIFVDGAGSALGMDPTQMYVVDIVSGTGCIARDSVQQVDGDLWFLSYNGLQSLGRLVTQKSNPLENLSKNMQDYIRDATLTDVNTVTRLRSAYSPRDRFYLLSLPDGTGGGESIVFDTRSKLQDGSARCMGTWTIAPPALTMSPNNVLYMALYAATGKVGTYSGSTDDGAVYSYAYESGWLDMTQQGYLLVPKRVSGVFFTDSDITVAFRWSYDFSDTFKQRSKSFQVESASLWGTAVWGTDTYGGGVSLRTGNVSGSGTGEYIKVGITAAITGSTFAVQQLDIFAKVGRYR
jgi:hypothetical protein